MLFLRTPLDRNLVDFADMTALRFCAVLVDVFLLVLGPLPSTKERKREREKEIRYEKRTKERPRRQLGLTDPSFAGVFARRSCHSELSGVDCC